MNKIPPTGLIMVLLVAVNMVGCESSELTLHDVGGDLTRPVLITDQDVVQPPGPPPQLIRPLPKFGDQTGAVPASQSRGLQMRVDTSSPDAMVASLQRAEPHLTGLELDRLRVALTTGQMVLMQKVAILAGSGGGQPTLTDDDLFQMAYGKMNGMTMAEVIDYGERVLPTLTSSSPTPPAAPPNRQGKPNPMMLQARPIQ